jgi:Uma2 family endonuclease
MTLAPPSIPRILRRRRLDLRRMEPDDVYEIAQELNGRPVPGIRMSEGEFLRWALTQRVASEWMDGEVLLMAPVSSEHSDINRWLISLISLYIEEHDLGVLRFDFFVRLPNQRRLRIPDLIFISKERTQLIHSTYLDGAPELVFEIISRDSQSRDRREKYFEYERGGIREYWIVDPFSKSVEAYQLQGKKFGRIEEAGGILKSSVLRNFWLRPEWLSPQPLPRISSVLKRLRLPRRKPKP